MTAVGDGPTVAGTAEAAAPQPAEMTAMSAERMRKPAGRRRARVGIIGPLARVAIDANAWLLARDHGTHANDGRGSAGRDHACLPLSREGTCGSAAGPATGLPPLLERRSP